MAAALKLSLVTPAGVAASTAVDYVTAPGFHGEFGVLPGHTPFITRLLAGVIAFNESGQQRVFAIGSGLVEINNNEVLALVDFAEEAASIDAAKAKSELEQFERELLNASFYDEDHEKLRARVEAAGARVRVSSRVH